MARLKINIAECCGSCMKWQDYRDKFHKGRCHKKRKDYNTKCYQVCDGYESRNDILKSSQLNLN